MPAMVVISEKTGEPIVRDAFPRKTIGEVESQLLAQSIATYRTRDERAALRCALADGVALLDKFAEVVADAQRHHRYIKKRGREDALLVRRAADLLWHMREKIRVE